MIAPYACTSRTRTSLAIHNLAYAALTLLTNYDEKANKSSVWAKIVRDHPHEWSREIANFLKHADRDPHHEIPDVPECVPEYLLHKCARIYAELAGAPTREMDVIATLVDIKFNGRKRPNRSAAAGIPTTTRT